ncbi:cytochrome c oxidase assembly protein [Rhizobium leguminosarum]|nr:cytochrome c oxidase assembly protein [Rhizobium leguminosarum]
MHLAQHLFAAGTTLQLVEWHVFGSDAKFSIRDGPLAACSPSAPGRFYRLRCLVRSCPSWHPLFSPNLLTADLYGQSPLEDQQLAGLLMWVPASLPYVAAFLFRGRREVVSSRGRLKCRMS